MYISIYYVFNVFIICLYQYLNKCHNMYIYIYINISYLYIDLSNPQLAELQTPQPLRVAVASYFGGVAMSEVVGPSGPLHGHVFMAYK